MDAPRPAIATAICLASGTPEGAKEAVAEGLCRDLDAFAQGEEQADDLTVLVVEYRGDL